MEFDDTVLTNQDIFHFEEHGFVVLKNAVCVDQCERTVREIEKAIGKDSKDPNSWFSSSTTPIGFAELYHTPCLWENRCNERIYRAFVQLLGVRELWVSIDRIAFKPPAKMEEGWNHGGFLHWDRDVWCEDRPLQLQGVLALVDTDETMGGFHCVPGSHKKIDLIRQKMPIPPSAAEKFHATGIPVPVPAKLGFVERPIPMKAGDFLIFSSDLAHGNGYNSSERVRIAQYITFFPNREHGQVVSRQQCVHLANVYDRIESWRSGEKPCHHINDVRKLQNHRETAELPGVAEVELNELGQKLLGIKTWYEQ